MKNQISLSVGKPCAENWDHFTPGLKGKFCHSCNKNVIDFTKMGDEEILHYFSYKSERTCGRFRPGQLKTYVQKPVSPNRKTGLKWMQAGFLSLLLMLLSKESTATNDTPKTPTEIVQLQDQQDKKELEINAKHTIKGVVTDEYKEPLAGVNVMLKGDTTGTITDINGQFQFPEALEVGDVLVFSFIGFEWMEYTVPKNAPAVIEIPMIMLYYDIMGEVAVDEVYTAKPSGVSKLWMKFKTLF